MATVEHFIQRGNKEKPDTRRRREGGGVEGKCLLDRHHKSIIHSLLLKHSLSSASLSSLTVFLSLLFLSHMKKSFCGYSILTVFATLEKKKEKKNPANDHCLSCWWTVGRVFEHCGFLLDRDKKKK